MSTLTPGAERVLIRNEELAERRHRRHRNTLIRRMAAGCTVTTADGTGYPVQITNEWADVLLPGTPRATRYPLTEVSA